MRLFNKLYVLFSLAACSLLYSGWILASHHYKVVPTMSTPSFRVAPTFQHRLVVFGDSWSDNDAEGLPGFVWTDWLCSLYSCHHENMAQTVQSSSLSLTSSKGKYVGAVVDNSQLDSSGSLLEGLYKQPLADFGEQADQWLTAELNTFKGLSADAISERQNNTIVAVSFGVWDLWNLIGKDIDTAKQSAEASIATLMDQLTVVAERWGTNDMKVILTLAPDVTFLPAFEPTADRHKDTIQVFNHWNKKLRDSAQDWARGTVYLFDTNAFLLDVLRDWQLFAAGIEEENGLGKNEDPGWENVEDPCVQDTQKFRLMSSGSDQCDKPDKYLFWDEMHLGPSAHRLMGTEIFHGIEEMWLKQKETTSRT
ncbi:hypothetical protein ASPZODRAFT_72471 [Penicilliopsis zonata CBS 506.65]|uniref:SGNH hydrolase-type esterase domain-containing protein n=1 Tax=Penicilliopsis zonata CBS 506.65 TaxID=1073090 RepID=A0A1L9SA28_9EURO|nr:hypothetical protein ASPZODRAFT_72471 [Penicilliopsis zonata CBS 506.65]OJJ44030.1 hypothetical protein ASPZODRAFT_72471 [Penicilliopsis zonata CBS 506.65]